MLTEYGRLRKYKDGIEFEWHVEEKLLRIVDENGKSTWLPARKVPTLQRFLVSVQHLPKTKLREKK